MDVQVVKVLVILGLFVFTLGLGLLPLLIIKCMHTESRSALGISFHKQTCYRRTLSILSCFATGVFLATCLLGLLPDVRRDLESALEALEWKTEFPISEFAMVSGLFIILTIEQVICIVKERQELHTVKSHIQTQNNESSHDDEDTGTTDNSVDVIHFKKTISNTSEKLSHNSLSPHHIDKGREHSHTEDGFGYQYFNFRVTLLLLAVSLHSLFEGLAVGLQKKPQSVIGLFIALLLHKGILSFSLGMNFIQTKLSRTSIILYVAIFGLSAPLGILVGIGIVNLWVSGMSRLVQGVLQGIACGSFLYITFFDVLPREFNSSEFRLVKVAFLTLGFTMVTGIVMLELSSE